MVNRGPNDAQYYSKIILDLGTKKSTISKIFQYFNAIKHTSGDNTEIILCNRQHYLRHTMYTAKLKENDGLKVDLGNNNGSVEFLWTAANRHAAVICPIITKIGIRDVEDFDSKKDYFKE
jgi:hypothetical protein